MQKEQTEFLTSFYRAYLTFVDTKENPFGFQPTTGLCHNLFVYSVSRGDVEAFYRAVEEMERQFRDAGLDKNYPFNNGSGRNYDLEMSAGRAFYNNDRMNWVRYRAQ